MPDSSWSMRLHLQELEKVRRRPASAWLEAELEESMCAPSEPPQWLPTAGHVWPQGRGEVARPGGRGLVTLTQRRLDASSLP